MMQNNYRLLFSVSFLHSYFEDGYCKDLLFQLNEETQKLLSKFGFKTYIKPNGFELCYNTTQNIQEFLNYIETTEGVNAFQFGFITTNPNFYIYTESPINEMIQYDFNSRYISENSNDDTFQLALNTKSLVDSKLKGIVTIHFEDILNYFSAEKELSFSINFLARKTLWEYNIINNSNLEYDTFSIVNDSGIIFSNPVETVLQNGQKTLKFQSEQLLSLSEKPQYQFHLFGSNSPNEQETIFSGLPNANPSNYLVNEEGNVVLPMYIYI